MTAVKTLALLALARAAHAASDNFDDAKAGPISATWDGKWTGSQTGDGAVWRAKDANNYHVARANALEDNATICHTIGGWRVSFKSVSRTVAPAVWHTLRVVFSREPIHRHL